MHAQNIRPNIRRIDPFRIEIEKTGPMLTTGLVYANHAIEQTLHDDNVIQQLVNVASLPGIIGCAMAMPDIHWGYGFPIGGVAAFSKKDGIISPGGVGYDINCGVSCILTNLRIDEVRPKTEKLLALLFSSIPSGVGSTNKGFSIGSREFTHLLEQGLPWAVKKGYVQASDLEVYEDEGCIQGADPDAVSARAIERGLLQLGTLGSGNHFVELGCVDMVFDETKAGQFGLFDGQVVILVHTGSRGLGYQVCEDHVRLMVSSISRHGINLPDRQLACTPITSREGKEYFCAMASAANFAFVNRGLIGYQIRESFEKVFNTSHEKLGMRLLYDCCHNIAKMEQLEWKGKEIDACIHRKGATRNLGPGDKRLGKRFKLSGQPIVVPGDMGRMSFILSGSQGASETFFSACHGAGRILSRNQAKTAAKGRDIIEELSVKGIRVMAASRSALNEEMPEAYKHVSDVVDTITGSGVAVKVARLKPFATIKG